jgi:hypothetical protein
MAAALPQKLKGYKDKRIFRRDGRPPPTTADGWHPSKEKRSSGQKQQPEAADTSKELSQPDMICNGSPRWGRRTAAAKPCTHDRWGDLHREEVNKSLNREY